jgi:hypothetical protein
VSPPATTASASPVTSDTPARPAPARQTAPVPR